MQKTITAFLGALFVFVGIVSPAPALAASTAYTSAETSITQVTSVQELNDLLKFLKKQIKIAKKAGKGKGSSSATGENLTIDSITVAYPEIGGGTTLTPDQKLTVKVKNNEFGSASLTYAKLKYEVNVYEIVDGKKKNKFKAATGEAYVPYANGYSEFQVNIEGGLPFDGEDMEREFIAEVEIDKGNKVKESNEKDNEAWSDSWLMTYYKG